MTNSITSDKLNPKPKKEEDVVAQDVVEETTVAKKAPAKKAPTKKPSASKTVTQSENGKKYVWFESGFSYSSISGLMFSQENRMAFIDEEEANRLLELDNFRNCTDEEIADFIAKNQE